jgi:hypothetical protein
MTIITGEDSKRPKNLEVKRTGGTNDQNIFERKRSKTLKYEDEKVVIARRSDASVTDPDPTSHIVADPDPAPHQKSDCNHWPPDSQKKF